MWTLNFKMVADAVKEISKTITVLSGDIRELTEEVRKLNKNTDVDILTHIEKKANKQRNKGGK